MISLDTPLGIACGRNSRVECIPPLIAGDAHIDFRGSGELTPIHRAAIGGNVQAIKVIKRIEKTYTYDHFVVFRIFCICV